MSIFKNQHQLPWRTLLQQIEFSILHLQKVQKLKKKCLAMALDFGKDNKLEQVTIIPTHGFT